MFSSVRGFLNRHKRKLLISSALIGGVILLTRYAQKKIREWQEKEIRDLMEKTRRRQYFESTEKSCNQVIQSVASSLRESVAKNLDTEAIVDKLRNGCSDKVACWNELKVLAIARSAAMTYSQVMLVTLIRIQFNVMGGHLYKESQNSENLMKEDNELQTKYMSLCSYFLQDGIKEMCTLIKDKVQEITAPISLKNELKLRDLEQIYWAVVSSISTDSLKDPVRNVAHYMLPPNCEKEENSTLSRLINETLDLLESEEVQNLVRGHVRTGFVLLVDHISEYFINSRRNSKAKNENNLKNGVSMPSTSSSQCVGWADTIEVELKQQGQDQFVDVNKVAIPMAKIIPIINGQVPRKPTARDVPTDWLQRLMLNDELRTLGANIYEAFSF